MIWIRNDAETEFIMFFLLSLQKYKNTYWHCLMYKTDLFDDPILCQPDIKQKMFIFVQNAHI